MAAGTTSAGAAHRVRRLAFAVRGTRDSAAALAWRAATRGVLDDALLPALGAAFDAAAEQRGLGAQTLHVPRLQVHVGVRDPQVLGDALRRAVEAALQEAIAPTNAPAPTPRSPAERADEALLAYLLDGRLPWADDHGDAAAIAASLRTTARAWFERLLAMPRDALPQWLDRGVAADVVALSRWVALLDAPDVAQALAPVGDARGDRSVAPVPFAALARLPAAVVRLWHRLAPLRAHGEAVRAVEAGTAPLAQAPWARPPEDDGAAVPTVASRGSCLARTALEGAVPAAVHSATASSRDATAKATWLAHDAGLVLLHPYLPTLLDAVGALDTQDGLGARVHPAALPRAAALLHWLATGRDEAHEFELTVAKLLLGVAPDAPLPLDPATSRPTAAMREEGLALLAAVIAHWSALGSTSVDSLRVAFLARDGLLARRDDGWHLRVADEPYDLLLARLPWAIGLVRLPWMREPLHVQWGST